MFVLAAQTVPVEGHFSNFISVEDPYRSTIVPDCNLHHKVSARLIDV